MRIAILTHRYPPQDYAFVHARAKLYVKEGHQVKIFIPIIFLEKSKNYVFEKIDVIKEKKSNLIQIIDKFEPDVLAVHAPKFYSVLPLVKNIRYPKIVWIHGAETLFYSLLTIPPESLDDMFMFPIRGLRDIIQIITLRSFLQKVNHIVFVSKWMKKITEKNLKQKYKNSSVIPNPVDTDKFTYKRPKNTSNGVSIRGLGKKYGLDIAIKAYSNFKKTNLTIIGSGKLEKKFRFLIKKYHSNTKIETKKHPHERMPEIIKKYDYFVAPSRVEAQGVAMCEAMSCGLPVVATNVGGIPEFVRNDKEGYLVSPNDPKSLRECIFKLINNKKEFIKKSRNARKRIIKTCSPRIIMKGDIEIFENLMKR